MNFNEIKRKMKHYKNDKGNVKFYVQYNVYERVDNELISLTQIDKRYVIFSNKQ